MGGVVIYPDNGGMIINYPEQHIANGRKKNNDTNHHYKKMVRIMKKMRYLMEDSYITAYSSAAKNVSSFMLESLIATLQNRKNDFWGYKEANGIKELCTKLSDYTNLCNFIDQLASFYEYE